MSVPLSTAAKAALCLCPPAVMAGTVATVPAAKRAVHHITAPHRAKPVHRAAVASARPQGQAQHRKDCDPVIAGAPAPAPIVTYAAPIPAEPVGDTGTISVGSSIAAPGPSVAALAGPPAVAAPAVVPPVVPAVSAIPEPATWAMVITGVGAIGLGLRRRRKDARAVALGMKTAGGVAVWGTSAAVEAGDVAATVAVKSAVASVATKAMLCVCPAAVVAGSVMAVPPLRRAVHASTIPAAHAPAIPGSSQAAVPCDGPMTVPVSATSVSGFPDSVTTVAAAQPALVISANSETGSAADDD